MSGAELAPRSRYFMAKGLRLHYLEWGDAAAPLMIMLHGGLEHAHSWDELAGDFARDYRVVCLDLRGHGDSDWTKGGAYSVLDGVYDLYRLFRHLEADRAVLVGHSFGGNIAVRYAALFPESVARLVAIEGLALGAGRDPSDEVRLTVSHRLRDAIKRQAAIEAGVARRYPDMPAAVARLMEADSLLSRATAEQFAGHALRRDDDGLLSWKYDPHIRGMGLCDVTPDELRLLWSLIRCPALLIYGAKSWASNPAEDGRIEVFRDAQVLLVPDAGHNVHHHQPEAVRVAIADFLHGQ